MGDAPRLRMIVATGLGVGYAPVVPGTFGSLPGVLLAWILGTTGGPQAVAVGAALVIALGFWSAGAAARHLGATDPRPVVVDEIAGQMLTLLLVPPTPLLLVLGFFVFRVLDVVKPFPIRRLEALPGSSGIMADDLAAGMAGGLSLWMALRFFPALAGAP